MSKVDPDWPTRADHRFILRIANMLLPDKYVPLPEEFDLVSRVFSKAGGSWKRVYGGSAEDIEILRKVIKIAYKNGHLTKSGDWGDE